jgi:hypothetical protein
MKTEFDRWWDKDLLTEDNPYVEGTPAYWAWEGWSAGVKAEREACAKVCEDGERPNLYGVRECLTAIRARGNT